MNDPTVLDKIRETEGRHAAGVDDRKASPGEERGVHDDEVGDEHEKDEKRRAA